MNSAAGTSQAKPGPDQLAAMFAARGLKAEVWSAADGAELESLSRRAVLKKPSVIVAGGGDGTINCVASALLGTPIVLGVLPLGTLNHFARDMKIPVEIDQAVAIIAAGQIRNVDVGEVNGRIFLNNSSLGLYPRLVREREKLQRGGNGKWAAFAQAMVFVLLRYSQLAVRLDTPGQAGAARKTPFIFVGNNKYRTAGWEIGTRETLNSGRLWLYVAPHEGSVRLIMSALRTLMGRRNGGPAEAFETSECWVTGRKKWMHVATDGEVTLLRMPLHYLARSGVLRVMAPDVPSSDVAAPVESG